MRRLRDHCRDILVGIGRLIVRHLVVKDFREFVDGRESKRALVAYLVSPLSVPARFRDRVKFSNRGIAQEMVRALNELGYLVDIVNFDNTSWVPKRRYDIFIGHAAINFTQLARRLPRETVRIYFATGMYWREANDRLATRLYRLALRRGVLLPAHRAASEREEYSNRAADGIICLGNGGVAKSYSSFGRAIALNNGVYPIRWDGWLKKDFAAGRKHFLFFAGSGNVLKGLDLVLEAFRDTDMHLHVCQHIEPEFWALYRRECETQSNCHFYGHVRMRSPVFQRLARQCNWVISASCTEGQPGAILECMGHGLIPIVPDTTNIDADRQWALRIDWCEVESVRKAAMSATQMSAEECQAMARRVVNVVRARYTPDTFREGFKTAVGAIVEERSEFTGKRGGVD